MPRFAHIADVHLGFQRDEALQGVEQDVFESVLQECIDRRVDFVVISGDLFHVNIPEMRVQKYAFAKFREVHEAGIPVYAVYGSHDFSPVRNSVIDLLAATGYITKVSVPAAAAAAGGPPPQEGGGGGDDGLLRLGFVTDPKTGAKLAGLPGLKAGVDEKYYDRLDRDALAAEPGFKIFVFHGGYSELRTERGREGEYMPLSKLPPGFDNYAAGHMHAHRIDEYPGDGYPYIVYPGTPFAGYHSDLEENARGQERCMVVAQFDRKVTGVKTVRVGAGIKYATIYLHATDRTAESARKELAKMVAETDAGGRIVVLRAAGELTAGRPSEVGVPWAVGELKKKGAVAVKVSSAQLSSMEVKITGEAAERDRADIERDVLGENIGEVRSTLDELMGDSGRALAERLLSRLSNEKLDGETAETYSKRILCDALAELGLGIGAGRREPGGGAAPPSREDGVPAQ